MHILITRWILPPCPRQTCGFWCGCSWLWLRSLSVFVAVFPDGETQIWPGDLRVVAVLSGVWFVLVCNLFTRFSQCQDRASERNRLQQRNKYTINLRLYFNFPPCLPQCHDLKSNSLFKLSPPYLPQCHNRILYLNFSPLAFHNAMI